MKKSALKWLTTVPVAVALAFSLAACGGSTGATSSDKPTDALAGSDQVSLDKYTTADVTPLDKIKKDELGLIVPGTITVGTLSDAPPNIFIKDGKLAAEIHRGDNRQAFFQKIIDTLSFWGGNSHELSSIRV